MTQLASSGVRWGVKSMDSSERRVKVTDLLWEQPPAVLLTEAVPGPSGRLRLFTQKVQVQDASLWARLTSEVRSGDTIKVTVRTVWPDEGRYYTCLEAYARVEVTADVGHLALASA